MRSFPSFPFPGSLTGEVDAIWKRNDRNPGPNMETILDPVEAREFHNTARAGGVQAAAEVPKVPSTSMVLISGPCNTLAALPCE